MRPIRAALIVLLASCGAQIALADAPPAQFTVSLDGDAAIWNPFEGFEACESISGATLCLTLDDVFCDGAGICACDATFEFNGVIEGSLTGPCRAKVSCNRTPDDPTDDECKAKLRIDASGPISGPGVSCDAELSNFVVNGLVDYTGLFQGKARSKICLDCSNGVRDCAGVGGLFEYAVNPPIPWELTVNLVSDPQYPSTFTGTAEDSLGPFSYTATGRYDAVDDESTFTLKGVTRKADPDSVSQGAKIKLEELGCAAGQCTSGTATFKVQGNKVKDAPVGGP